MASAARSLTPPTWAWNPAARGFDIVTMTASEPNPSTLLVDAIPIGTLLCTSTGADIYGSPWAVDGNGDGGGGCDAGAVEAHP